uniref:Dual specificity protein phosphatase n=1 Tax=Leptobrachium leishanense TaxID=445787 RepID=A0A8C5PVB8_9ANUR
MRWPFSVCPCTGHKPCPKSRDAPPLPLSDAPHQYPHQPSSAIARFTARDKSVLRELGITHILNAASGRYRINTGPEFYKDLNIDYYGVEADDDANFNMSTYFYPAAQFISAGLQCNKGKVLVHCAMGISRAASLVLAFLMISEGLSLLDALRTVSEHRDIFPNHGFLEQLRQLDIKLQDKRRSRMDASKI